MFFQRLVFIAVFLTLSSISTEEFLSRVNDLMPDLKQLWIEVENEGETPNLSQRNKFEELKKKLRIPSDQEFEAVVKDFSPEEMEEFMKPFEVIANLKHRLDYVRTEEEEKQFKDTCNFHKKGRDNFQSKLNFFESEYKKLLEDVKNIKTIPDLIKVKNETLPKIYGYYNDVYNIEDCFLSFVLTDTYMIEFYPQIEEVRNNFFKLFEEVKFFVVRPDLYYSYDVMIALYRDFPRHIQNPTDSELQTAKDKFTRRLQTLEYLFTTLKYFSFQTKNFELLEIFHRARLELNHNITIFWSGSSDPSTIIDLHQKSKDLLKKRLF
jgi:hypothetical protein